MSVLLSGTVSEAVLLRYALWLLTTNGSLRIFTQVHCEDLIGSDPVF